MAADSATCPNCGTKFQPVLQNIQDAYQAMVIEGTGIRAYARDHGIAPPTAMLYRRLAIAVHVIGIDPDSMTFRRLQDAGAANKAEIAAELQRPGATPERVESVLDLAQTI